MSFFAPFCVTNPSGAMILVPSFRRFHHLSNLVVNCVATIPMDREPREQVGIELKRTVQRISTLGGAKSARLPSSSLLWHFLFEFVRCRFYAPVSFLTHHPFVIESCCVELARVGSRKGTGRLGQPVVLSLSLKRES